MQAGGAVYLNVQLRAGFWISPARLVTQMESIGFVARPTDIRLTVTGRILQQGDRLILQMEDIKMEDIKMKDIKKQPSFELLSYRDKGRSTGAQEGVLRELSKLVGKTVELEGYWRDAKRGDLTQTVLVTRLIRSLPE